MSSRNTKHVDEKQLETSTTVSTIDTQSSFHRTETQEARQFMHPLELNDKNMPATMQYREKKSTLVKTKTQEERQLLHPLELNDKLAFETIKTVRLDFLTEEAKAPIPRCQALPDHAFSKLTGRSILVALSHGWFFQTHPDPYGEKLDLIKKNFAPRLRERYPHACVLHGTVH